MRNQNNRKEMINPQQIKFCVRALLVTAVVFVSCGRRPEYNEFIPVDSQAWSADSSCVFTLDVKDSVTRYDLLISIRHTSAYPYQNLWLFIEQLSPDSLITRDTIACTLADHTGRWIGTGTGTVYLLPVPFKQQFRFSKPGVYQYSITHGMRDKGLKGINAIGLKSENRHGKK